MIEQELKIEKQVDQNMVPESNKYINIIGGEDG